MTAIADEHEIRSSRPPLRGRRLPSRSGQASQALSPTTVSGTLRNLVTSQGRDAMVAFFTTMLDGWNVFLQGLQSGVVVLDAADADRATGRWFVQEVGQRAEGTNLTDRGRLPRRVQARSRSVAHHAPPVRPAAAKRRRRQ